MRLYQLDVQLVSRRIGTVSWSLLRPDRLAGLGGELLPNLLAHAPALPVPFDRFCQLLLGAQPLQDVTGWFWDLGDDLVREHQQLGADAGGGEWMARIGGCRRRGASASTAVPAVVERGWVLVWPPAHA